MTFPDLTDPIQRQKVYVSTAKSIFLRQFAVAKGEIEFLINATPSGKARSDLTDVNIHLMQAKAAFEAIEWPKEEDHGTMPANT